MEKIKKGDIVGRISYGKDIFFIVDRIIILKNGRNIAILKGLTIRIKADSLVEDLEIISSKEVENNFNRIDERIASRVNKYKNFRKLNKYGKVLHLDGDSHLSNRKKCSNINTYKQVIFNHD